MRNKNLCSQVLQNSISASHYPCPRGNQGLFPCRLIPQFWLFIFLVFIKFLESDVSISCSEILASQQYIDDRFIYATTPTGRFSTLHTLIQLESLSDFKMNTLLRLHLAQKAIFFWRGIPLTLEATK